MQARWPRVKSRGLAPVSSKLGIGGEHFYPFGTPVYPYRPKKKCGHINLLERTCSSVPASSCYARTVTLLLLHGRHSATDVAASFGLFCNLSVFFFQPFFAVWRLIGVHTSYQFTQHNFTPFRIIFEVAEAGFPQPSTGMSQNDETRTLCSTNRDKPTVGGRGRWDCPFSLTPQFLEPFTWPRIGIWDWITVSNNMRSPTRKLTTPRQVFCCASS